MAKYIIKLTKDEVDELKSIIKKGSHTSQAYRAAYVLLNCDAGEYSQGKSINEDISKVLKIGMRTIDRINPTCHIFPLKMPKIADGKTVYAIFTIR